MVGRRVQRFPLAAGERGLVALDDNLAFLRSLPDGCVDLVYIDPPFNTGEERRLTRLRSVQSEDGTHVGFAGRRYVHQRGETLSSISRRYSTTISSILSWNTNVKRDRLYPGDKLTIWVDMDAD